MKYNIRKNWVDSFALILKHPAMIMPFVIISFVEILALELIYFSTRPPVSFIAGPIIKKFYGEAFLHYPANLVLLPKIFYSLQLTIYIFVGVYLTAISVNIFKNLKAGLPLKVNALVKNGLKNYASFISFGIAVAILIFLLQKTNSFVFWKAARVVSKFLPQITLKTYEPLFMCVSFLTSIIMQALLLLTIPIIVIQKKPLLKAFANSVYLGGRHFLTIFPLILLPFLAYLPITLLKGFSVKLIDKTFPEMTLAVTFFGILVSLFIDCFVIVCAAQFLINTDKTTVNE